MDIQTVLEHANQLIFAKTNKELSDLQKTILIGTLQDKEYLQIALESGFSEAHVKEVGKNLWQNLSDALGERITKSNFKSNLDKLIVKNVSGNDYDISGNDYVQINNQINNNICGRKIHSMEVFAKRSNSIATTSKPSTTIEELSMMPQPSFFISRLAEINELRKWIIDEKCQLINISGIVGIGKTALAVNLVQELKTQFDFIIWRNFYHPVTLTMLQTDLLQFFSKSEIPVLPSLFDYLKSYRCLLILDNIQNIFTKQQLAGHYQNKYADYRTFWQEIAELSHHSCLIVLSQEKLAEIEILESNNNVQSLILNGLGESAQTILQNYGLTDQELWLKLIQIYDGHPLWLKLIGKTIQDLCHGSVAEFLENDNEHIFLGNIVNDLNRVRERLSEGEKQIMSLLAKTDTALTTNEILANLQL